MYKIFILGLVIFLAACGIESGNMGEEVFNDNVTKEEIIQKGKVLFNTNCKLCHSLDKNTPTSLAPVLDSIKYHWPDKKILAKYIKNAPNMMQEMSAHGNCIKNGKTSRKCPPSWL